MVCRWLTCLGLAAALAGSGCDATRTPVEMPEERFVHDARLRVPDALPAVSLSIVKTAEFAMPEAFVFSGGRWGTRWTGSHSAVLVRHPRGNLLFDTGLGTAAAAQFDAGMPFWLKPVIRYTRHVPASTVLGGEAATIGRIVLSHMHWDHVGGVEDFPDAEVLVDRKEYESATHRGASHAPAMPSRLGEAGRWRMVDFADGPYENFDRSHDLHGDGSVVLVPLPGHTPGALGMFVNLRSGRRFLFAGDAAWARDGFTIPADKFWIVGLLLDADAAAAGRTLRKIARLMRHDPDLVVVPAHDEAAQREIGFYPLAVR